jgi:uncharacterized protein
MACVGAGIAGFYFFGQTRHRTTQIDPDLAGVIDPTGFLQRADIARFNRYIALIHSESNIDIRIVLDRPPAGTSLESAAVETMQRLGIGRRTEAQTGLLLYFDLDARRLKVEVGYGLEAHFPDVYVAFLVERHAPLLFVAEDRSASLRHLLRLLQARVRDAALGGEFDPVPVRRLVAGSLSGGAGSTSDLNETRRARVDRAPGSTFGAGATPGETYAAYLALLAQEPWQPDSDVFTAESREFLKGFPISRGYKDFILLGELGKRWTLLIRGERALLYFTSTPFVSPHFFHKQGDLWRMDLIAALRNTKERVGGPLTWTYEASDDPYTTAFSDLLTVVNGYTRIAGGDNRLLPMRAGRDR